MFSFQYYCPLKEEIRESRSQQRLLATRQYFEQFLHIFSQIMVSVSPALIIQGQVNYNITQVVSAAISDFNFNSSDSSSTFFS